MTNLENLKKLADGLGADASKASTNLEALNVISKALGGSGDAGTNAEAISDIVGASLDEMASPAMLKGIIDRTVTEVVIPEGTEIIGNSAFSQCKDMKNVHIPDSVDRIDTGAFMGCTGLTEVTIPNATEIGISAFGGCTNITKYYISDRIACIKNDAFGGNTKLTHVYTIDGIGEIPEDMMTVADKAQFGGAMSLVYAEVPKGIRKIADSMFGGCSKLETVIVHDNLESVERAAFGGCSKFKTLKSKTETITGYDVIFPQGMKKIGGGDTAAFGGCSAITSVYIPSSVESIGSIDFGGCMGITKIDIDKPENSIEGAPWGASNATVNWLG